MGKPTGFLEFERKNNSTRSPLERIKDFSEFHPQLAKEDREQQGARCMNCGVPFCQSGMMLESGFTGCPLHNLIPEWNDEIYSHNWENALSRLLKTNNFPEFTGRVCPALCEAACTCGLDSDPVTIRENELAIIENGYKQGYIKPRIPKVRTDKRVAVIGSGPAGLTVADMLNLRGHNVTVYEKEDRVGGLLMYGIPNMKLDKKIVNRKVRLMAHEGIRFIVNTDVGRDISVRELMDNYDAVVLCCGAKQPRTLNVSGMDAKGVYFAVDFLTSVTKSFLNSNMQDKKCVSAAGKNVVVVGGGDTGNDCVGTCIRQGCNSVVQLEMMEPLPKTRSKNNPWPQWPKVLKTDYGQEEAIAVFGSDPRVYCTTVKNIIADESNNIKQIVTLELKWKKKPETGKLSPVEIEGSEKILDCDLLLIAAGFTGCEDYVSKEFEVETTERNCIKTEKGSYRTENPKVFAAGDIRRGQSLVVWAIAEGRECAKEVDRFLMGYSNMI